MPWAVAAAAIGAGGAIFAGSQAADAQQKAGDQAIAAQRENRDFSQKFATDKLDPFVQSGTDALASLKQLLTPGGNVDFLRSLPGYQFQKEQGTEAIEHAASTRNFGGNTLRELDKFGTGLADQSFMEMLTAFMNKANAGQGAAGTEVGDVLGVSGNTTNNISDITLQKGNVAGAQSSAMGTSIGNFVNNPDVLAALKGLGSGGSTMGSIAEGYVW